jgi:hypothetical protein
LCVLARSAATALHSGISEQSLIVKSVPKRGHVLRPKAGL